MDPTQVVLLLAAGGTMGFINNLAGAGGIVGLFALEWAAGLTPGEANTSLRISALAIGLAGLVSFRSRGHHIPPEAWRWTAAAVPGAVAGAFLAVELPVVVYQVVLATVLALILWQQLRRRPMVAPALRSNSPWLRAGLFFAVGLHMGFIQVATGLVSILALMMVFSRDLVQVNTVKMALVIVSASVSSAVLIARGAVHWTPALWLATGCAVGSFAAARWSITKGHGAVRLVVIAIAALALIRVTYQVATG